MPSVAMQRVGRICGRVSLDRFARPADDNSSVVMGLTERPPAADRAAELGLEGSRAVRQSRVEQRIDLVE